ncbi:hypothetical protein Btru_037699 [Bulinus truncatus]|nr:hypothetical protein Btru_037699 [Bulinus truncatus]
MPEMDTRLVIPRFIYKVFHKMSRKCFRNKCRCDTKCFVILSCAWCVLVIAFSVTQTSHSVPSGRQSHKAFSQDIHQLTPQTCVHPELFVDDPVMNTFLIRHPPAVCNGTENWVYTQNGAVRILPQILETYRDLLCDYFPLQRHGDYSVTWGEPFINITSGFLMTSDFFRVVCKVKGQVLYDRAHAGVAYTADRVVRQEDPLTEGFGGLGIAILGFDSMSRMSWLRRLNKTRQYFHDVLGAVELMHHNIVGDGTTAVMLPMLTGKFEWELPESSYRDMGSGGTPNDMGSGGTPNDMGSGGTPNDMGSGGTPNDMGSGGTPNGMGCGGTPNGMGSGGTPNGMGSGGTPNDMGSGGTPNDMGSGGTPNDMGSGGTPNDMGSDGTPNGMGSGGTPNDMGSGGTPNDMGSGGTPNDMGSGGTPMRWPC